MENCYVKSFKSPWGGILCVKCVIGEGLAIFTPLQCGVTLPLVWIQEEESSAVQLCGGSHILPESGHTPIRFKLWGFAALGLCVKTYRCYLWSLHTIEAFMCTASYSCCWKARWNKMPPCRCICSTSPFNPQTNSKFTAGTNNSFLQEPHNYSVRFEVTSLHLHMEIIRTFNYEAHSEWGCAVALLCTGVIPLVFQAEAGKLEVGLPFLAEEQLTVLPPGQIEPGGAQGLNKLHRAGQSIGRPLLPHIEHLLLKPALIHAGLSYK